MVVSSLQNGWQSASCFGPGNAALAPHECAAACVAPSLAVTSPCVEVSTPIHADRSPVRPFWQHLEDSNNRDRLERAAIAAANAKPEHAAARKATADAASLATLPALPTEQKAKAQAAYAPPAQRPARLIDVVA